MKPSTRIIHNHVLVITISTLGNVLTKDFSIPKIDLGLYVIFQDLLVTLYLSFPFKKHPQMQEKLTKYESESQSALIHIEKKCCTNSSTLL